MHAVVEKETCEPTDECKGNPTRSRLVQRDLPAWWTHSRRPACLRAVVHRVRAMRRQTAVLRLWLHQEEGKLQDARLLHVQQRS
jgi:hypothetical protein